MYNHGTCLIKTDKSVSNIIEHRYQVGVSTGQSIYEI